MSFEYACKLWLPRAQLAAYANHPRLLDMTSGCLVRIQARPGLYRLFTVSGRAPNATAEYAPDVAGTSSWLGW